MITVVEFYKRWMAPTFPIPIGLACKMSAKDARQLLGDERIHAPDQVKPVRTWILEGDNADGRIF